MAFRINNVKTFIINCGHQLARPNPDGEDKENVSFRPSHRMDPRRNFCVRCRQRLWSLEEGSKCPSCEKLSPDRVGNNCGGFESLPQDGRNCRRVVKYLVQRMFHKIQGLQDINDSVNQKLEPPSNFIPPSSSLNHVRGKKRAVLIGITYSNWKYKLKGTVNDVNRMKDFLIRERKFPENNIRVLTEEEQDPCRIPTKKNIEESLKWLVEGCEEGDSLVFYFSGHGVRTPDFKNDERDGLDEALCPVDFQQEGLIIDNEINSTIVWPLKKGVTLHAFVDACHSGTALDLVHVYNRKKKEWIDNSPPSGARKHTNGGLTICISACEDSQVAADTSAFSKGDETNGALTFLMVEILKERPELSYGHLLDSIYEFLDEANRSGGRLIKVLRRLFHRRLLQESVLSASEKFDVYERKIEL